MKVVEYLEKNELQDIGKIVQIRTDISGIRYNGMVRKTAQREHLSELKSLSMIETP